MQQYQEAVEFIANGNTATTVITFIIAVMVLLILLGTAVDAYKKLFAKKPDNTLERHCEESEERFKRGEKHIAENHDHIADLKEGQRVLCVAVMALLNHDLHNGNSDEMQDASAGLNHYLINRK